MILSKLLFRRFSGNGDVQVTISVESIVNIQVKMINALQIATWLIFEEQTLSVILFILRAKIDLKNTLISFRFRNLKH